MIKRLLHGLVMILTVAVFAAPSTAFAQAPVAPAPSAPMLDRVPAPPTTPAPPSAPRMSLGANGYTWDGVYGGFSFGYGGSMSDIAFNPLPNEQNFDMRATSLNPAPMGWTYGFNFGWDRPVGTAVFGLEFDFNWSTIDGETEVHPVIAFDGSSLDSTLHADQNIGWMTSIRARYGWVLKSKCMVYATGGVAFAEVNNFVESDFRPEGIIVYSMSQNDRRTGWTIGGGIEGGFNDRWGWRGQYLFYNFGSPEGTAEPSPANPPFQMGHTFKNMTNSFTFGVNYKF